MLSVISILNEKLIFITDNGQVIHFYIVCLGGQHVRIDMVYMIS